MGYYKSGAVFHIIPIIQLQYGPYENDVFPNSIVFTIGWGWWTYDHEWEFGRKINV